MHIFEFDNVGEMVKFLFLIWNDVWNEKRKNIKITGKRVIITDPIDSSLLEKIETLYGFIKLKGGE